MFGTLQLTLLPVYPLILGALVFRCPLAFFAFLLLPTTEVCFRFLAGLLEELPEPSVLPCEKHDKGV